MGDDPQGRILPFRRAGKNPDHVYQDLVRWFEGQQWWDEGIQPSQFFPSIDDQTFEVVFSDWISEYGKRQSALGPTLHHWISVFEYLTASQFKLVFAFVTSLLDQNPPDAEGKIDQIIKSIPLLSDEKLEHVLAYLSRVLTSGDSSDIASYASKLLYLYKYEWQNTGFPRVFVVASAALRSLNPDDFGLTGAALGELGLPRPGALLKQYGADLDAGIVEIYRGFWTKANLVFRRTRIKVRRRKRLLGRFGQAWGLQKSAIERILREARALNEQGFSSASIVWCFMALEVFFRNIVARALLQGYGLHESMVTPLIDEFFNRNGKAQMLRDVLIDYFGLHDVSKNKKYWNTFEEIRKLRNDIVHKGSRYAAVRSKGKDDDPVASHRGRVLSKRDGAENLRIVEAFLEEVPRRIDEARNRLAPIRRVGKRLL